MRTETNSAKLRNDYERYQLSVRILHPMKIPVIIEITDKTQQRHSTSNLVTVRILDQSTRLPFFQFEVDRQEACRAFSSSREGRLDGVKIDGNITTS
jgi:hypothetical protein